MADHEDRDAAPVVTPDHLAVPVAPVPGARRSRGPWVVLAAMLGVIAVALVAGRLFPAGPEPSVLRRATPAPSPPPASVAPTVSPLTADELRAALNGGTLAGWLVVVDGSLEMRAFSCASGEVRCSYLELFGLEGVPVELDVPLVSSIGDGVPDAGILVFRAGVGELTYLGTARENPATPLTVAELESGAAYWPGPPTIDQLVPVSGWLVVGGIHPCHGLVGGSPCPPTGPWLTDVEPTPEGLLLAEQGLAVQVDGGVRPRLDQVVTAGPFLVRYVPHGPGDLPPWHVAARLDPERVVRVVVP